MLKLMSTILFAMISLLGVAQLSDKQVHDLKSGRMPDDTSFVYCLPYVKGKSYLFVQGANSKMSHQNELSFDFKMKKGSKICASRDGIVVSARGDSEKGGLKPEYYSDGNYIIIRHADSSEAYYWHLDKDGVYVKEGEYVTKGQIIGASGNTGYTAFPHLHFHVMDVNGKQILVRFNTKRGVSYLRPGNWYKAIYY